jgi:L-fucose isomerase-like protein
MAAKENKMQNMPDVKIGLIAVSRDCFPASLSKTRRTRVAQICSRRTLPVVELKTLVETELDIPAALDEMDKSGINALVVYLGNFGPEGPASLLVQNFNGPVMIAAAAEESSGNLMDGRGDAYCGMLSLSYNLGLRSLKPYIPAYPLSVPEDIADMIAEFMTVARIHIGLKNLKIFTFGPRPHDFLTCNAPIKPLYDLGVEIMENSELDLLDCYQGMQGSPEIKAIAKDMAKELGGNPYPDLLPRLAQYELALTRFVEDNLGVCSYGVMANKCWPAFEKYFGFVPCYVNSRLASRGMPVACETDVYGALSEYMAMCATGLPATILDINNTVPADMISKSRKSIKGYRPNDLFMGFHCGNTPYSCMAGAKLTHHFLMNRLIEDGKEPDTTRGVLEGAIRPGDITIFRLQSTADAVLKAYIAEGEVLDVDPRSFGGTGVFAVDGMARFYRHVLIEHRFPHHTAVAFSHAARPLFSVLKMLGISRIFHNLPQEIQYPSENPF